jgi:hypothetical protein
MAMPETNRSEKEQVITVELHSTSVLRVDLAREDLAKPSPKLQEDKEK